MKGFDSMKKYSTALVVPIIIGCLLSSVSVQADCTSWVPNLGIGPTCSFMKNNPKKTALGALGAFLLVSIFHYKAHKKPKKDNPTHYNLDLLEFDNLTLENLYYIWDEWFIGIPGNGTESAKVDPVTKKIYWKEKSYPQGIIGWTDLYLVPTQKTADACFNMGKYTIGAYIAYLLVKHHTVVAQAFEEAIASIDAEKLKAAVSKNITPTVLK